jgi:cyclic-di-GMP phosphodiesterase, flagellum assembly factor TipF
MVAPVEPLKGHVRVYWVLLVTVGVLGIAGGLLTEWLAPESVGNVPGWAIAGFVTLGGIVALSALKGRSVTPEIHQLSAELEAVKLELDGVREELSWVRDQLEAIPDTSAVVAEIRVLQGLMGQFTEKRGSTDAAGTKEDRNTSGPAPNAPTPPKPSDGPARAKEVAKPEQWVHPEPMRHYADDVILHYIEKALREDRVDLYLQPTVRLPQRKRVFYECFSRITDDDGNVIRPEQYLTVAAEAGLITAVDNLLLFRCVQLVRRARRDHLDVAFFCNISDATLTDVDFFTDFIDFMAANQHLAESLVFEFSHPTVRQPTYDVQTSLQRLSSLGFKFSVDKVGQFDLDLPKLASQGFKYVKIDAHLLHEMARGDPPRLNMRALKGALDREAMDLIVEKIETEEMLLDLLDLNIDFGQGYLFGEPRPTSGGA